ncbi:MAG: adenylate/guanylate cyclase domain-containing response regulator [Spirochaetia bacterium]|nr:adenylate/guanylate cyclase domain-containing response regulator [Spirochaetia bacterium]
MSKGNKKEKEKKEAKVLAVEDDSVQRRLIQELFSNLGYTVKTAETGEEGIEIAKEFLPDVILLDVYLPGQSGIEVLNSLKQEKSLKNTIIVMMSTDTSEDTTLMGLANQADEFIYKPVRSGELAVKMNAWLERKRNREELEELNVQLTRERKMLSQYFSEDVVSKILSDDENASSHLKGENLTATILFFDIRNFTSISEKLSPDLVADLLNLLFSDIMDLVFSHNGSINKLIGDAILATFGCPYNTKQDALNAVNCALDIRKTIEFFNKVKPKYLEHELSVGIGIATGQVFAGNIGSYRRMEYTVIGDVVNTASRLQNLTKKAGVDIIIDGETQKKASDNLILRRVRVKNIRGKEKEVEIFALDGIKGEKKLEDKEDSLTFF